MTRGKIKKYSVLGLVLLAASAVAAAIVPFSNEAPVPGFSMTGTDTEGDDGSTDSCHVTNQQNAAGGCVDETFTANSGSGSTSVFLDPSENTDEGTTLNAEAPYLNAPV